MEALPRLQVPGGAHGGLQPHALPPLRYAFLLRVRGGLQRGPPHLPMPLILTTLQHPLSCSSKMAVGQEVGYRIVLSDCCCVAHAWRPD